MSHGERCLMANANALHEARFGAPELGRSRRPLLAGSGPDQWRRGGQRGPVAVISLTGARTERTAPYGPAIWAPLPEEPLRAVKRSMIDVAAATLEAGEAARRGDPFTAPTFGDDEFDALEAALEDDHEQAKFLELAIACQAVIARLLTRGS